MKLGVFTALLSGRTSTQSQRSVCWAKLFHVHAKDTQIFSANLPKTGVLNTKPYTDERNRSWIFRTCGYGHDASWWKEFISTLHLYGYRGVLSIEHEDSLLSADEGLTKAAHFLNELIIREQPNAPWWV
jgi:sugar phosphate isomerase/epimerase